MMYVIIIKTMFYGAVLKHANDYTGSMFEWHSYKYWQGDLQCIKQVPGHLQILDDYQPMQDWL